MRWREWLLIGNLVTVFLFIFMTMNLFEPHQWALNAIVNLLFAVLVVHVCRKIEARFEEKEAERS